MAELLSQSTVPTQTTADMTLYVSTTGLDTNTGSSVSAEYALRTLDAAVARIPSIVNHVVTIYISDGTYPDTITINGFSGKGTIRVAYNSGTMSSNAKVFACYCMNNTVPVEITNIYFTSTSNWAMYVSNCTSVTISKCTILAASAYYGIYFTEASGVVSQCKIDGRATAVFAYRNSTVHASAMTGASNSTGYAAQYGSRIHITTSTLAASNVLNLYGANQGGIINVDSGGSLITPRSYVLAGTTTKSLLADVWNIVSATANVDTLSEWNSASGRFTPTYTGVYQLNVTVTFVGAVAGQYHSIRLAHSNGQIFQIAETRPGGNGNASVFGTCVLVISAGQYVSIQAMRQSAGDIGGDLTYGTISITRVGS